MGLVYQLDNGRWEGVIKSNSTDKEVRILRSDKIILLIEKSICDQVENPTNNMCK